MKILRQTDRQSADEFAKYVDEYAKKRRRVAPNLDRDIYEIIKNVRDNGDSAVYEYEKKFGGLESDDVPMRLSDDEIASAYESVSDAQLTALNDAARQLEKTESATMKVMGKSVTVRRKSGGRTPCNSSVTRKFVSLSSVGCYIPGGLARYPSSAVMSIIPAKVAQVSRIVAVSPVSSSGKIDALTIVAADMCGATEIYRIGGAHAIAALAYGTESIARVDKIVGPGGSYVTAAKSMVSADVGIDMLAGPTELGIIADSQASPRLVALDLISQSEHSADTQCYLITASQKLAKSVNHTLNEMTTTSQLQRADIIRQSLTNNGFIAVVKNPKSAMAVANRLAAEHLQIITENPARMAESITTPGIILCGAQAPSAASDYLLGSNHVLPTNRMGTVRGSLSALDFVKMITIVESSDDMLDKIAQDMKTLAGAEGLTNHYEAVRGRLKKVR